MSYEERSASSGEALAPFAADPEFSASASDERVARFQCPSVYRRPMIGVALFRSLARLNASNTLPISSLRRLSTFARSACAPGVTHPANEPESQPLPASSDAPKIFAGRSGSPDVCPSDRDCGSRSKEAAISSIIFESILLVAAANPASRALSQRLFMVRGIPSEHLNT